jgi:hypothetical protein
LTQSFLAHQAELIVGDVKELVSRVSDVHFVEADNLTVPAITYEVGKQSLIIGLEYRAVHCTDALFVEAGGQCW